MITRLRDLTRKHAVRQGSVVLIDQGALSIATFIAGILVARACSQEDYGLYVLGWSILLILQGFHKALVNVPFTVYAPRLHPDERALYQGSTLVHTILIGVVMVLALYGLGLWNLLDQEPKLAGMRELLPLLAAIMIPFLARDFMRNAMLAQLEVSASVFVNLTATALMVAVMTAMFVMDKLTLAWSFHLYTLTSALATLYMLWTYRTRTRIVTGRIWRDLKKGWQIGKWIFVNTLGFMAASQAYPWLLLFFEDARSVAVFGVCLATAGLLTPLLRGATAYMMPRMAHTNKDGNTLQLAKMLRLSILVLTVPYGIWFIIGSLFGDEMVTFFYSDTYSGYGLLMALLLGKTFIESASAPLTNALMALERADITTASLAIGAVVTLGLGSIMIQKYGLNGAGFATVLSSAASAGWKWMAIRKILDNSATLNG